MTLDEAIEQYKSNAEYERTHGNLQGCLEFRQLADWLKDYKKLKKQEPKTGHWIGHREHCENLGVMPNGLGVYEWCSNCDCGIDIREWQRNPHNYCPNCGSKNE